MSSNGLLELEPPLGYRRISSTKRAEPARVAAHGHGVPRAPEEHALLGVEDAPPTEQLPRKAITCFFLQHLLNTFTTGLFEFACFLFLIEIFVDSLIPASLVGLCSTLTGLAFSGWAGGLVDRTQRLGLVRRAIGVEKVLYAGAYGAFSILLGPLALASPAFHGDAPLHQVVIVWGLLLCVVAVASMLKVAKTALTVAFERDWVTVIANGNQHHLTFMNGWIRRIDLCSKLGAPFVVSLMTATAGYPIASSALLCSSLTSMVVELVWVQVVYNHFDSLTVQTATAARPVEKGGWDDFVAFSRLPVFWSSLSISCIYLTTLSYDGTFIAYIKAARGLDDAFIAGMRGLCILTGMLGTLAMPLLEGLVGLERAGAWSIWFEAGSLLPVVLAFFVGPNYSSAWDTLMFGGIAVSRIGLWSFDLCQLKELQLALDSHPRRNRLTALQLSFQNLFDLLKYVLTLCVASPALFRYTAAVSWAAMIAGGALYTVYLRKVRGHIFHLDWIRKGL